MKRLCMNIDQLYTLRSLVARAPANGLTVDGVRQMHDVLQIVEAPLKQEIELELEDAQFRAIQGRINGERWQVANDETKAFLELFRE